MPSSDEPGVDVAISDNGIGISEADQARIFDRFEKDGQLSLAVEVTLQPVDKSYDEAALKAISDAVVAAAAKMGAELRG